jgi:hypothetical protein
MGGWVKLLIYNVYAEWVGKLGLKGGGLGLKGGGLGLIGTKGGVGLGKRGGRVRQKGGGLDLCGRYRLPIQILN